MVSFSGIDAFRNSLTSINIHYLSDYLNSLVNGYFMSTPLWYLYLYIGILLSLPILRKLVKNCTDKDYLYFFIVFVVINTILPVFERIFNNEGWQLSVILGCKMFYAPIGYLLFGYWFYNYKKSTVNKKKMLLLCTSSFLVSLIASVVIAIPFGYESFILDSYAPNVVVMSTAVFCMVVSWFDGVELQPVPQNIIVFLGRLSFGTFLFERMIRNKMNDFQIYERLRAFNVPSFLATLVFQIGVFVICVLITFVLKKIPGIKKLL